MKSREKENGRESREDAGHFSNREAITHYNDAAEREPDKAPLSLGLIRRLHHYTIPHARRRNALFALTLVRGCQLPALAWLIGCTLNGPIAHRDWHGITLYAAGYLALALATVGVFHFRQRYALELGEAVVHDLRRDLFARVLSMPMGFYNRTKFGRLISRMTSDIDSVRAGVQDVAFVLVVQVLQMAVSAALMAWYDWKLFVLMLALAPAIWVVNRNYQVEMARRTRRVQESWSRVSSTLAESVGGVRVTQAFVRQDLNSDFFGRLVNRHGENNVGVAQASAVFVPLLQLKSQLFLGAMVLLGGYGALRWHGWMHMDEGDVVMFFFLASLFFDPVQVIGNQLNQALTAMAGAERLFRLMDEPPDWQDAPEAKPLGRIEGRVDFENVHFHYQPGRPVLSDITFTALPGQSVALVGHTGSGKTTLAALLQKFYLPTEGIIRVDGVDLTAVSTQSLRRQMGSVPQNNYLFTGTVLENLRLARPDASVEDVLGVLAELDCLDLVKDLPEGLHTRVTERGASLSLGQRQWICFARAMLANPRIVVLDEATSAIDSVTEARLQRALERLLRGRTAFIVAHRLSTIRKADLVLVLDRGRIAERGTHDSLLKQQGLYARLHDEFTRATARG